MKTNQLPTNSRPDLRRAASLLLLALALAAGLPGARAATGTPPDKMTYQGFLADASGTPLGNANPVNYVTVFRLWPADTGGTAGTALWSEVQTVTIDKGSFSVVLGDGLQFAAEAHGALSAVFASPSASDRFLEITVTIAGTPVTIAPRLRLVAAPYSLLARNANSLLNPDGTTLVSAPTTGTLTINGIVNATSIGGSGTSLTGVAKLAGGNTFTGNQTLTGNLTNIGTVSATSFVGDGSGLTGLPGAGAQLTGGNAFTGNQSINSGNLGIGTSGTNFARLEIQGGAENSGSSDQPPSMSFSYRNGGGYRHFIRSRHDNAVNSKNSALDFYINSSATAGGSTAPGIGNVLAMTMGGSGTVGIGSVPSAPLSVTRNLAGAYDSLVAVQGVHMGPDGTTSTGVEVVAAPGGLAYIDFKAAAVDYGARFALIGTKMRIQNVDLVAEQFVFSQQFIVNSDVRIKAVEGRSSGSQDLNTLLALQVTDYRLKDGPAITSKPQKKLIAQEVKAVFPQAVSTSPGVIADIYQDARFEQGWVKLKTDLKVGEWVRLIVGTQSLRHEVLEVNDSGFRTELKTDARQVFVYGREVKDFHYLEYDAIAMLNVSATQELARQVEALRQSAARIAELEQKVSRLTVLEGEVAEMKKLLARLADPRKDLRPAAEAPAASAKPGTNP